VTDNADKLAELRDKRAALAASLTRDGAERAARTFAETAKRRADVAGFILGGAAIGDPLQAVLNAFAVDHPDFERWLIEKAQSLEGITLTDKQRDSQLKKLDAEIAEAEKEHLAARKQAALEQVEAEYAA
jgi:hypothetical protein